MTSKIHDLAQAAADRQGFRQGLIYRGAGKWVNRRAQDRNGLALEKGDRLQVVDFACYIKNRDARGKPSQLYSRETALALLGLTTNFTGAWTKETAIDALNQAFDWVERSGKTMTSKINNLEQTVSFNC